MTDEEMNLTDEEWRILSEARTAEVCDGYGFDFDYVLAMARTISTLRTQLSEAREGLKPFAEAARRWGDEFEGGDAIVDSAECITVADLRRAAAILKEGE